MLYLVLTAQQSVSTWCQAKPKCGDTCRIDSITFDRNKLWNSHSGWWRRLFLFLERVFDALLFNMWTVAREKKNEREGVWQIEGIIWQQTHFLLSNSNSSQLTCLWFRSKSNVSIPNRDRTWVHINISWAHECLRWLHQTDTLLFRFSFSFSDSLEECYCPARLQTVTEWQLAMYATLRLNICKLLFMSHAARGTATSLLPLHSSDRPPSTSQWPNGRTVVAEHIG